MVAQRRWSTVSLLAWLPWLLSVPLLVAGGVPRLEHFRVLGYLSTTKRLQVPFDPPFEDAGLDTRDFVCKVDNAMASFKLIAEAASPSVISELSQDGKPVLSRENLTHARLAEGEQTVFTISVTDEATRRYTLVVVRRLGSSLELLGLRPKTAVGERFSAPFRPGELQERFRANQSFYEDFFVVEYDFADGGQDVQCQIDGQETIGDNVPRVGQIGVHPHKYVPALEQLHHVDVNKVYNLHSPGAGPTARCSVPIDTWRRITVGIHIVAADQIAKRSIMLEVTRTGCAQGEFYHHGACIDHCPTYFYPQEFNWRCGRCNEHCQFCEHWHHCQRCQMNTTMYRYAWSADGTCRQGRTHPYRVYYDVARYLAMTCAGLFLLYSLVGLGCILCRICRRGSSREESRLESLDLEERVPLTGRTMPLKGHLGLATNGGRFHGAAN